MKVETVAKHKLTQVVDTDAGKRLMAFVTDCLEGRKDELYRGNNTDGAHLQAEFENIVNALGEHCYDEGYKKGLAERR